MSKHFLTGASTIALLATMSVSQPVLAADPASLQVTINEKAAAPGPTVGNHVAEDYGSSRRNRMDATANAARGLLEATQNNGNNNALSNATGVQVGGSTGFVKARGTVGSSQVLHFGAGTAAAPDRENGLTGSLTGLRGLATVQQNNGDGNDIGAATGVLVNMNGNGGASGQTAITDGLVELDPASLILDVGSTRRNGLTGSLNDARGVATVQQNNGNANAISATSAVGVGMGSISADQQAASLGIVDSVALLDPVVGLGAVRSNVLDGSLTGARGLFTIQENNGDGNVMGATNAVNVHAGPGQLDRADQSVTAAANLRFAYTRQGAEGLTGDRSNATLGTAGGQASGVANFQQNNGDSNAVTAANAVNAATAGARRQRSAVEANAQADAGDTDALGAGQVGRVDRGNTIGGNTASRFQGMATIQQNNGDTNGMSAAAGVQVTGRGEESSFQIGGLAASHWLNIVDTGNDRRNRVEGSFQGANGIAVIQQNNGDGNGMSAGTGVGAQLGGAGGTGNLRQTADAGATISGGLFTGDLPGMRSYGGERTNTVTDSFRGSTGLMAIQQNNGNGNAVNTATSLVAGLGTEDNGTARQTTRAGAGSAFGTALDSGDGPGSGVRSNAVTGGAFDAARGVATVTQNNGNNNALSTATSVAADRGARTARESTTRAAAEVVSNTATARRAGTSAVRDRGNAVTDSFTGFRGVATVQQNNGDGNAMSVATGVTASRTGDRTSRRQTADATTNVVNPLSPLTQEGLSSANAVSGSFNGAAGVGTVQQNTGNANAMAVASAFDAGTGGDARQTARAVGAATSVVAASDGATRGNRVDGSFTGARGAFTVQQNTGDGNALGVASAFMLGSSEGGNATADARLTVDSQAGDVIADDTLRSDGAGGLRGARTNGVAGGFNQAAGVATVQQNAGNGNSVNAGTLVQADARGGKRTTQAAVRSKGAVADNDVVQRGDAATGRAGRTNAVTGSFGAFRGIATAQQNTGDGNAIGAGTAVSATRNGGSPVAEAGASATAEQSVERSSARQLARTEQRNAITGTANTATGILTVQQNTGNNNAMSASSAVAAVDGGSGLGAAVNVATLSATVAESRSVGDVPGNRASNQVSGSAQGLRGLASLQQNNGHNNAMQSAIVVTATY